MFTKRRMRAAVGDAGFIAAIFHSSFTLFTLFPMLKNLFLVYVDIFIVTLGFCFLSFYI